MKPIKSDFTYDLLIIGGGISACVFASKYLKKNIAKKLGYNLVDHKLELYGSKIKK